jgi:thioredoxin 1
MQSPSQLFENGARSTSALEGILEMSTVAAVDQQSFPSEVLASKTPVLVDFWAAWCGPCRMLAPVVEKLAESFAGRVKFVKLDTEENPDVAGTYGIRSIPCLILFKDGKEIDRFTGFDRGPAIEKMLTKHLTATC